MNRNTGDQVGDAVIWENERFRVWDQTIAPGETVGPHVHANDYFIVTLEATEVTAEEVGPARSDLDKRWRNLIIDHHPRAHLGEEQRGGAHRHQPEPRQAVAQPHHRGEVP